MEISMTIIDVVTDISVITVILNTVLHSGVLWIHAGDINMYFPSVGSRQRGI